MNDAELMALKDNEKAAIIKRVLSSRDGKKFKRLLELHLQTDQPSGKIANFVANEMFYHDGQRSVFCLMNQVMDGLWDKPGKDPMNDDDEPEES